MQHYFNVYPSTPTITSLNILNIGFISEGFAIVIADYYSVDIDTTIYYRGLSSTSDIKVADMPEHTYSAKFAVSMTYTGIFGMFSSWKIADVTGIPGLDWDFIFY